MSALQWEQEAKLRCLELALAQAQREGRHGEINRVVEISSQFYNHIAGLAEVAFPEPEKVLETPRRGRKSKADKASPIFE